MAGNPFDQFDSAPQTTVDLVPLPEKPQRPPAQTPAQAAKDQLEVKKLQLDLAKTPETDPALAESIKNLGLDEWLTNVSRARDQIGTGFATGVLGNIAGHFPGTPRKDFLGALEGIKGATILEKLQALRAQSKNGSSGMGSLTEQEGERLANSVASLNPDMSAHELLQSLDIVERHAKALQAIGAGKDPNDPAVQQEFGIKPLPGEKPAAEKRDPNAPLLAMGAGSSENPIANGYGGDMGPTLAPSSGDTRSVVDPRRKAIADKVSGLLAKGANRNQIMGFAVGADPSLRNDAKFRASVDEALAYRAKHPKAQFSIDPAAYTYEVPLSAQEKVGNAVAQSAPGAAVMNAGNAVTAGNMGKIFGDEEGVNRALAVAQSQHPGSSLAGNAVGAGTAALGLEGLLGLGGVAPSVARGVVADSGYGGITGATNSDNPITGGLKGLLIGAGGSLGGLGLGRAVGSGVRGVVNPSVSYVAKEAPLTIGQAVGQSGIVGKSIKGLEDRVAGLPIVGDAINARRLEGLQKMNSKAFDRALEPIKESVAGQFGEQAVAEAQDKVSGAFQKALGGKVATLDHGFIVDAEKGKMAIDKLPDSVRDDVNNLVDGVVNDAFDDTGQMSGENLQAALRGLGEIKRSYNGAPAGHRVSQAVDRIGDSIEGLFRRQAPDVMPQYEAAKQSFKRLSTLEDAVLRGKNTNGVFTPAQLGMADRANTMKFGGKHAAAAGKSDFHDFQRNMQEVLPNKVPDSGTAGRLIVPAAIVGAGTGAGYASGDTGTGLTLASLLALAYSRTGQRALTASVLKRPEAARAAGQAVRKRAPLIGRLIGPQAALGSQHD